MIVESIKEFYQANKTFLLENYPGLNEKRLIAEFGKSNLNELKENFSKLSLGIPLEYITGKAYFYNSEYLVNKHTLIPRYETEGLVELAKNLVKENDNIADVGTGCGNIILSLVQELKFAVKGYGYDISEDCIQIASSNSFRLRFKYHPQTIISFQKQDRLLDDNKKYNLILSNPPYIKKISDLNEVHEQVKKFEPHHALFLDDNEYESWFEALFKQVSNSLESGGSFLMEGHENHLESLELMAKKYFSKTEIKKDLTNRARYLITSKG